MISSPTTAKPLPVPAPKPATAQPFVIVSEEELAPYSSTIVSLPPTVPELIQCLEKQHERCAQMTNFIARVRAETTRMAAAVAAPLNSIVAEALSTSKATALNTSSVTTVSTPPQSSTSNGSSVNRPPAGSGLARGVVAKGMAATSGVAAVTGTVVRGTVFTGKVVSAAAGAATDAGENASSGPSVPVRAVVASTAAATMLEDTSQISADELQALRVKAIALEATQQLLAKAQEELQTAEHNLAREQKNLAVTEERLAQMRADSTAKVTDTSSSQDGAKLQVSLLAQTQISLELSEAALSDTKLKYQSALYTLAQLNKKMAANAREKAFLEEKNTHLEGQLQRLLMSSMVTGSPKTPTSTQRSSTATTTAAGSASSTTSAQVVPAATRLTPSETYQKSALEKQICELQSMADRLTRDLKTQTARRAKAEEKAHALQKEVTELKAAALQFRRQINESELELERAVSRKEDDERLRQLERDCNCLRTALRERTEHFLREQKAWESEKDNLEARARVQEVATRQLLRRLLAYQVREVTLRQCEYAAATRKNDSKSTPSSPHVSQVATPAKTVVSPSKRDAMATADASRMRARPTESSHYSVNASATAASPVNGPHFSSSPSVGPVVAATDTAALVNRDLQLEELKHTFERRIAFADAQRKAEVQRLQALNKELRAALTASQEELTQKSRLLDIAQQQKHPLQLQQRLPLTPVMFTSSANLTPMAPARSASSISERRDTAAAWVCRTDGEGSSGVSMDDLSDGVGGTYSGGYSPLVASPRKVGDIERRYDPESMSTWEAVQLENEALLDRITTMQEEKWKLTSYVEDLQRQSNTLKEELKRNASTMNQLLAAGVLTPAAVSRGSAEGNLRALQCLLQETLREKFALEEKLRSLSAQ